MLSGAVAELRNRSAHDPRADLPALPRLPPRIPAFRRELSAGRAPWRHTATVRIAITLILTASLWGQPAPRTYQVAVEYYTANPRGEIIHSQRLTGDYTRGLPGDEAAWKNVRAAEAPGAKAAYPAAQKRDFMEAFRYRNEIGRTMHPEFFKTFPPTAVAERNLVWDTAMLELYASYLNRMQPNQPWHPISAADTHMPGVGTFHNRDVVLEWIGRGQRNGRECALVRYQAFFNPLQLANAGMTLHGRSDYWGEIWISLTAKQIEYATLYETVVGEMKLPGQSAPQMLWVFRIGTLEPVDRAR